MNAERLLAVYEQISEAPDAIVRLRRFVLDLAVRGKLVSQDTSESAQDIGRSPWDGDAPYELPSTWRWMEIGDQLELLNGMAFKPTDWSSEGIPIVRIQNLNNPDAPFNRCDPSMARERSLIEAGSFLISWSGTPGTSFGAFIWDRGLAVLNQHIFRCDFKTDSYSTSFLKLAINGRLDEMIEKAHGGVGLRHITKGKLQAMLIAVPPLAEQHRIVAKVDELMALCDRLEAARKTREETRDKLTAASLARLAAPDTTPEDFPRHAAFALEALPALTTRPDQIKTLRQTILNLAVRGRLVEQDPVHEPASELLQRAREDVAAYGRANGVRPSKVDDIAHKPFEVPSGWSWTRLSDIFRIVTDGDHQPPPRAESGVAFLTIGNVSGGTLMFEGCRRVPREYFSGLPEHRIPAKDDILYTVVGATFGRPIIVDADEPFCVQRHIAILKPSCEMSLPYLYRLMASQFVYTQAENALTGAAQPTLALKPLRNFMLPIPPLAEQHRIVAKVDALMAVCDRLEAALTNVNATRSRLLEAVLHDALETEVQVLEAAE